jgi:cobalt-zinc-cadmium efflux system membrane fusion protein
MTAKSVRALLSLLAAGTALAACRKPPASEPETTAEAAKAPSEAPADRENLPESVRLTQAAISEAGITIWKVQPVDLEHMVVLTGIVDYDENRLLQIAANVKGRAAAIRVDLGARVRKGDPILEVESVELGRAREELLRELSSLRVSARAFERAKALVEAKAISAGEFQGREGDYLAKKAAARRRAGLPSARRRRESPAPGSVGGGISSGHEARLVLGDISRHPGVAHINFEACSLW